MAGREPLECLRVSLAIGVDGNGLTVAVECALSVEELVMELKRDRASFLVIVTTRHGPPVWTEPSEEGRFDVFGLAGEGPDQNMLVPVVVVQVVYVVAG